jgi:hypothetical protein
MASFFDEMLRRLYSCGMQFFRFLLKSNLLYGIMVMLKEKVVEL